LAVIESVDFFPPLLDDPYLFGQIAAANALSDIYAMGGRPILALNILSFPTCDYPLNLAQEILRGASEKISEARAVLAGGHSIAGAEPLFGLAVTGVIHPNQVLTNSGARPGDVLILSKPLGTGVALLGLKGKVLSTDAADKLLHNLTQLNDITLQTALKYEIHAATDVTGFGLLGHLHEMGLASNLSARLWAESVPLLPEVKELAAQGLVPGGAYANANSYAKNVTLVTNIEESLLDLLHDPQTSGGLLLAVNRDAAAQLVLDLQQLGLQSRAIGTFKPGPAGLVEVSNRETEN
jgi:selenide, water dikinase